MADAIARGVDLGDLTSRDGAHRLLEWANGPATAGAAKGVTRYLEAMRARRLVLQDSFQALEDEDGERYVHWARTDGRREGIPEALMPQPAPEAWSGGGEPPALGVNVVGYLRTGIGVGEAARLYVAALEAAGVPVRAEIVDPGLPQPKRTAFDDRRPAVEYPFNLVCVNAFELPGVARRLGAEFFADKRTIGVWAWEASTVPPALGRGVRARRRDLDLLGVHHQRARARLARAGGDAAAAGARAAGAPRAASCRSSSATRSRSCSRSTSSRPRGARTRSAWSRPTRAPSSPATARSS